MDWLGPMLHAQQRLVVAQGRAVFSDIPENRIKRDSFTSVADLEQAIAQYIEHHNKNPKPFIWTASADDILAKVTRAKVVLVRIGR